MEGHDNYKKKYEEMKNQVNTLKEKGHKLEAEN